MENTYVQIMIDSLKKKDGLLEQIISFNQQQKLLLQDPDLLPDILDENMRAKGQVIDEINLLDEGFEQLYQKVKAELDINRKQYSREISEMQDLIRIISEKGNEIKVQELRNRDQILQKFSSVRRQVREIRSSQRAVKEYYKSMGKQGGEDSYFFDNKK